MDRELFPASTRTDYDNKGYESRDGRSIFEVANDTNAVRLDQRQEQADRQRDIQPRRLKEE